MEGSRRRNPHDVGDVAGESSRSDQKIQGVDHFVVNLFLCLRDGSGLNCHLNDPSQHIPFSIYLSTILVPVRGEGSGVILGRQGGARGDGNFSVWAGGCFGQSVKKIDTNWPNRSIWL